jgi:ACT domain-containing protein
MQAVIAVTGKDYVGIIADVSQECKKFKVNISDVSQTVLKDYFVMIMLVELENMVIIMWKLQLCLMELE